MLYGSAKYGARSRCGQTEATNRPPGLQAALRRRNARSGLEKNMIPNREMIASNPSIGQVVLDGVGHYPLQIGRSRSLAGRVDHLGGDVDAADPPLRPDAVCRFDRRGTCPAAHVEHALTGFQVDNGEDRRGDRDQGCFHRRQMRQPEPRPFGIPPIRLLNIGHGCACLPRRGSVWPELREAHRRGSAGGSARWPPPRLRYFARPAMAA